MQPTTASVSEHVTAAEIPGMVATLCAYENCFGPYHPQTLRLMTEVGAAYWHHGVLDRAPPLLERAVRDVGRNLGRDHELRVRAILILRDVLVQQRDHEKAGALQREVWECLNEHLGPDHPETLKARSDLAALLLRTVECTRTQEV